MTLQLGFIGFGQMAQAMAKGFNQRKNTSFTLHASATDFETLTLRATPLNVRPASCNQELVDQCDWIVLAVKPDQVEGVLKEIDASSFENKCVISIASGITLNQLKQWLSNSTSILTMIPNTPVCVGEGILMCQEDTTFTKEELARFTDVFANLGAIHFASGDAFKSLATLSGCGPAFVAMVIEAMADGMVKYGAPRDLAYQMASQTIKGTAQMQLDTNTHPGALKDQVTSPGGTTIKGVAALEEHGMRHAFISAMDNILNN